MLRVSEKRERLRKLLKGLRKKPANGNSYFGSEARIVMTKGWQVSADSEVVVESETEGKYLYLSSFIPFDEITRGWERQRCLVSWMLNSRGELVVSVGRHRQNGDRIQISAEIFGVELDKIEFEPTLDALIANIERQLSMAIARKASEVATYSDALATDLHARRQ